MVYQWVVHSHLQATPMRPQSLTKATLKRGEPQGVLWSFE